MTQEIKPIELKLEGDDSIIPETFKAREVATIIFNLEEALRAIAIKEFPELDEEKLFISLVGVGHESNGLKFIPSFGQVTAAFVILAESVLNNSFDALPYRSVNCLVEIQKIIKQRENCIGTFLIGNERISHLSNDTQIEFPRLGLISGETTIYGIVEKVGGSKPRIVLRQFNGKLLSIVVSQRIAKAAASKLYSEVSLIGTATWSIENYNILDFKVEDISDSYARASIKESFEKLRNTIGGYWDEVDDIEEMLQGD